MKEKEKNVLLYLLKKANEEGLLKVCDIEENYHEIESMLLIRGKIYLQIN